MVRSEVVRSEVVRSEEVRSEVVRSESVSTVGVGENTGNCTQYCVTVVLFTVCTGCIVSFVV